MIQIKIFTIKIYENMYTINHNIMASNKRKAESKKENGSSKYTKLTDKEHVLARTEMYIGSKEPETTMVPMISSKGSLEFKDVRIVPAFLQLVEELVTNASDRISAAHEKDSDIVNKTKVIRINTTSDSVTVTNDGDGIPSGLIEEFGVHTPELIFGHLRSGSNYDDKLKRLNSGRNGLGAKLTNVFSKKFTVETICPSGKKYIQVFEDNLNVINKPKITSFKGKPYTKIVFEPDFAKLNMPSSGINTKIEAIIRRRAYELAATTYDQVKVFFNEELVKVNTWDKYMAMYVPDNSNRFSMNVNERWRICLGVIDEEAETKLVSFVNATATLGGTHVDHVVNPVLKKLVDFYRKKFSTTKLTPTVLKNWVFFGVGAFIENPTFRSQSKNYLSLAVKDFGSSCIVPDSIVNKLTKSYLTTKVEEWVRAKDSKVLSKNDGTKSSRIKGIPKLHDASKAGTKYSQETTLMVCEGDSALNLILSGITSKDREVVGAFPLRGKLLNTREASVSQIAGNTEITNLKKILGLQVGKVYKSTKELRYGSITLVCDQDLDGSHIKALLLNFFHCFWPGLITDEYIKSMSTPIVRATGPRKVVKLFYNDFEYQEWKDTVNLSSWKIKYLKGLGSSTGSDAKEYFKDFDKALVSYTEDEDMDKSVLLAFAKDKANDRKKWISNYDSSSIIDNKQKSVTVSEFIHKELVHFSNYDVFRSIPSIIDGLKPSQRKVLFGCFLKGIQTTEAKVAQLAAFIADKAMYHHGSTSLEGAVTAMAQDFVGSNNLNLLLPKGMLGSRLQGGKDAASPRYTFVQMNPLTPLIYRVEDSPILAYTSDDGVETEPVYYIPIIPMALVNSVSGIGSGYSTSIPAYNPKDLIDNIRNKLSGKPRKVLKPWYRGFTGDIILEDGTYKTKSVYTVSRDTVHISDLSIGTWTSPYKAFLEGMVEKKLISSYEEVCTDIVISFDIVFNSSDELSKLVSDSKLESFLKLTTSLRTTNMHGFSSTNQIKKFEDISEIEEEHFRTRLEAYRLRKKHVIKVLEFQVELLSSKAKFIELNISGKLDIRNVKFDSVIEKIVQLGFKEMSKTFGGTDVGFGYITDMNLFDLTKERVDKLMKQVASKKEELEVVKKTSEEDTWLHELAELEKAMK